MPRIPSKSPMASNSRQAGKGTADVFKTDFDVAAATDKDGIVGALNSAYVRDNNLKYMKMYDWMSYGYDVVEKIVGGFKYGKEIQKVRRQLMAEPEWKEGARVLYVSIGTGTDLKFFPADSRPESLDFYGADVSIGMLRKCKKNYANSGIQPKLIHACAEDLPFADNSFDIVFHVGGINFFTDKAKAISEMLRVAKPGSKLMLADETADYVESEYKKSVFAKKYFADAEFDLGELEAAIPSTVKERKTTMLWDGKFYCITFRKPGGKSAAKPKAKARRR